MEDAPHLLVVDDDERLRQLLRRYLTDQGFQVTTVGDCAEAERLIERMVFDLVVLDVMLPGETGVAFTARLRRNSAVPILLLTARGDVGDRIDGLEAGADDYLAKPFEPRELTLRIRTILRRVVPVGAETGEASPGPMTIAGRLYDPVRGVLAAGDDVVVLTEGENGLLRVLAARAGATVAREELSGSGMTPALARTVDVQITRLRRKVEPDPKYPRFIQTVRGQGYVLIPD
jgi:two-component system phosphate regulon response regulator OmpR